MRKAFALLAFFVFLPWLTIAGCDSDDGCCTCNCPSLHCPDCNCPQPNCPDDTDDPTCPDPTCPACEPEYEVRCEFGDVPLQGTWDASTCVFFPANQVDTTISGTDPEMVTLECDWNEVDGFVLYYPYIYFTSMGDEYHEEGEPEGIAHFSTKLWRYDLEENRLEELLVVKGETQHSYEWYLSESGHAYAVAANTWIDRAHPRNDGSYPYYVEAVDQLVRINVETGEATSIHLGFDARAPECWHGQWLDTVLVRYDEESDKMLLVCGEGAATYYYREYVYVMDAGTGQIDRYLIRGNPLEGVTDEEAYLDAEAGFLGLTCTGVRAYPPEPDLFLYRAIMHSTHERQDYSRGVLRLFDWKSGAELWNYYYKGSYPRVPSVDADGRVYFEELFWHSQGLAPGAHLPFRYDHRMGLVEELPWPLRDVGPIFAYAYPHEHLVIIQGSHLTTLADTAFIWDTQTQVMRRLTPMYGDGYWMLFGNEYPARHAVLRRAEGNISYCTYIKDLGASIIDEHDHVRDGTGSLPAPIISRWFTDTLQHWREELLSRMR